MAARKISALVEIGAVMASNVKTVFGGLNKYIDGVGSNLAKLKAQSREIGNLQKAQARLATAQSKGNAAGIQKAQAAVDKYTTSLRAAGVNTANLTHEQERLNTALARGQSRLSGFTNLKSSVASMGQAFAGLRSQITGLAMKGAGVGLGAGYLFKTQFIDTAAAFEKYEIQLAAFGDNAQKAIAWSEQFAMRTPLNLDQVVKAYVRLRQQGLDPTDGTLQALTDGIAKVGGEFYDLEEVINQLGQAFRKEKLTSEDVKPLINRGIPVYEMLSKALKKSTKEIVQMQEDGELGKNAIKGLLFELGRWSQGMSEKMSTTWTGVLGRMGDYWLKFTKLVMESGPFKKLKDQLEEFLSLLEKMDKDGTLKKWAEDTGKQITSALTSLREFGNGLGGVIVTLKDLVGGWRNFGIAIGAVMLAPTIASVVQLGWALKGVGVAMWGVLGPWGLLIGALIAGAALIVTHWEPIKAFFSDLWDTISHKFRYAINEIAIIMEKLRREFVSVWEGIKSAVGGAIDYIIQKIEQLFASIGKLSTASIGGVKLGDVHGAMLDLNPITGPARLMGRAVQSMMPADKMPAANGGTVTNNVNVKVDAPGAHGQGIADKLRSSLESRPLFDQTSVLSPR